MKRVYIMPQMKVVNDEFECILLSTSPKISTQSGGTVISNPGFKYSNTLYDTPITPEKQGIEISDGSVTPTAKENGIGWSDDWDF